MSSVQKVYCAKELFKYEDLLPFHFHLNIAIGDYIRMDFSTEGYQKALSYYLKVLKPPFEEEYKNRLHHCYETLAMRYTPKSINYIEGHESQTQKAINNYWACLDLVPTDSQSILMMGWCFVSLGKWEGGAACCEACIQSEQPTGRTDKTKYAFMNWGHACLGLEQPDKAKELYLKSFEAAQRNKEWFGGNMTLDIPYLKALGIDIKLFEQLRDEVLNSI
jgi:tetratricopeptide (TPR) repeat protein